jgi:hypothetical protein
LQEAIAGDDREVALPAADRFLIVLGTHRGSPLLMR